MKDEVLPLTRSDEYGPMRLMAYAEGYVMARRKGGAPFIVSAKEWREIGEEGKVVNLRGQQA